MRLKAETLTLAALLGALGFVLGVVLKLGLFYLAWTSGLCLIEDLVSLVPKPSRPAVAVFNPEKPISQDNQASPDYLEFKKAADALKKRKCAELVETAGYERDERHEYAATAASRTYVSKYFLDGEIQKCLEFFKKGGFK